MTSIEALLQQFVAGLDCIVSESVRNAFLTVERHRFVEGFYLRQQDGTFVWQPFDPLAPDPDLLSYIYSDNSLLIKLSPQPSSSSQPWLVARMLELLELDEGMHVLEIGAGTGYNAALMAEIVGHHGRVTTVEVQKDVAERTRRLLEVAGYSHIRLRVGDGYYGWTEDAPYDRIVATTACADIPPSWWDQLQPSGLMLIPLRHGGRHTAPLVLLHKGGEAKVIEYSTFGPAQGGLDAPGLWPEVSEEDVAAFLNQPQTIERGYVDASDLQWKRVCVDLHYFLGLNDFRTFDGPSREAGIGLWESPFSVASLFPSGVIKLGGRRAEPLAERLTQLYEEYSTLDRPRSYYRDYQSYYRDYQIQFTPRRESAEGTVRIERLGTREWVIERPYTRQQVALAGDLR